MKARQVYDALQKELGKVYDGFNVLTNVFRGCLVRGLWWYAVVDNEIGVHCFIIDLVARTFLLPLSPPRTPPGVRDIFANAMVPKNVAVNSTNGLGNWRVYPGNLNRMEEQVSE